MLLASNTSLTGEPSLFPISFMWRCVALNWGRQTSRIHWSRQFPVASALVVRHISHAYYIADFCSWMPTWCHTLSVSDVLYGNNIRWRSSFFNTSPNGLCSLGFGTIVGILKICGLRYPHTPMYISFLYVVGVWFLFFFNNIFYWACPRVLKGYNKSHYRYYNNHGPPKFHY